MYIFGSRGQCCGFADPHRELAGEAGFDELFFDLSAIDRGGAARPFLMLGLNVGGEPLEVALRDLRKATANRESVGEWLRQSEHDTAMQRAPEG